VILLVPVSSSFATPCSDVVPLRRNRSFHLSNPLPGVGKTAAALEIAYDPDVQAYFVDGILWAGVGRQPDLLTLLSNWGIALGIPTTKSAGIATVSNWAERIHAEIGMRRMLLIIDDAWALEVALTFKIGGPNCAYLLTTRQPDLARDFAEHGTWTVPELHHVNAILLLNNLAPRLTQENPERIERLLKSLDGLPLAIILIGRYLRKELNKGGATFEKALERILNVRERISLSQPLGPLDRHPSIPDENLSVYTAIQVSVQSLDQLSQKALHLLSLFSPKPNTFSGEAALAVSGVPEVVFTHLVEMGLVDQMGNHRYTLHQVIFDYVSLESNVDDEEKIRFVAFFMGFIEGHRDQYDQLAREIDNLQTAFDLAQPGIDAALYIRGVNSYYPFLQSRGLYAIAEKHLKHTELLAEATMDEVSLTRIWLLLGRNASFTGNYPMAQEYFEKGLALATKIGLKDETVVELHQDMGRILGESGKPGSAHHFETGLKLARALNLSHPISAFIQNLAIGLAYDEDYAGAKVYFEEGLELAREAGDAVRVSHLLQNIAALNIDLKSFQEAEECLEEGLEIARKIGHQERICNFLMVYGDLLIQRQNYEEALRRIEEGLVIAKRMNNVWSSTILLITRGNAYLGLKKWDFAALIFEEAHDLAKNRLKEFEGRALLGLARARYGQVNYPEARRFALESHKIFEVTSRTLEREARELLNQLEEVCI